MPDDLPATYTTFAEHFDKSLEERHEHNRATGDPDADFAKLSLNGQVFGIVDDPDGWRAAVRKQAREANLKIRTHAKDNLVMAYTLAYLEFNHGPVPPVELTPSGG